MFFYRRTDTRSTQKYSSESHKKTLKKNNKNKKNKIKQKKFFYHDRQTHVQLKTIVRNFLRYVTRHADA